MKKIITILFLLAFALSSSGMTLRLHYCCGKIDNISIGLESKKGCSHGSESMMPGCCNDHEVTFGIADDFGISNLLFEPQCPAVILLSKEGLLPEIVYTPIQSFNVVSGTDPPFYQRYPLYILYSVYRN